ncbi:MAG: 7-cyano-7-deazaguanine synthase QueC [Nitrospirae bacterium]|nr:7-cyano-7-deazaguanine synthase QueC [Nitrospirota bacterium]
MKKVKKAVVLLSGGIDSSTTLAIAKSEGYDLYALSFDYHQRHVRELESARMVAGSLGVKNHLIIKFDLREIGGSALTAEMEVPKGRNKLQVTSDKLKEDKNSEDSSLVTRHSSLIPVTYVPARNTIFLSFALGWAEVLGAEDIFIGANALDYSGYPDCRPEYLNAFEEMANLATKASVEGKLRFRINSPLLFMTKEEIIGKGVELGLDYSLTWSCYDPQKNRNASPVTRNKKNASHARITRHGLVPCGRCDSCRFREKGFREAGIQDPLLLRE